jgi:hypothetical protein
VCPTGSVRSETKQPRPRATIFPQEITEGVWRCGFNARSSFGAHSYFVLRPSGNLLVDSPRFATELVKWFEDAGGVDDRVLFAGDSLAWSMGEQDLVAFRDARWYSWRALTASLAKLGDYRFEWLLPGHGWPAHLAADEMNARLRALVIRMREG